MALGKFTLQASYADYVDGPFAEGTATLTASPRAYAAGPIKVGPIPVQIGPDGALSVQLDSDSAAGASSTLRWAVDTKLKLANGAIVTVPTQAFWAPQIGATLNLKDVPLPSLILNLGGQDVYVRYIDGQFVTADGTVVSSGGTGTGTGTGTGSDGASAYQVAVNNGYAGTEAQWVASLEGATGPAGSAGPAGPAGPQGLQGESGSPGLTEAGVITLIDSRVGSVQDRAITGASIDALDSTTYKYFPPEWNLAGMASGHAYRMDYEFTYQASQVGGLSMMFETGAGFLTTAECDLHGHWSGLILTTSAIAATNQDYRAVTPVRFNSVNGGIMAGHFGGLGAGVDVTLTASFRLFLIGTAADRIARLKFRQRAVDAAVPTKMVAASATYARVA